MKAENYPSPYKAATDFKCLNEYKADYKYDGFYYSFNKDPAEFKQALEKGPMVTGNSCCRAYFHYRGGIFNDAECNMKPNAHAIVMTGYGEDAKGKWWTIKNSWGPGWGEKGYIRLERHDQKGAVGQNKVLEDFVQIKGIKHA